MSYQKLIIVGRLGRDPETRALPDGTPHVSFSVAVSRRYLRSSGERAEETAWFRVSAWRKQAEIVSQYLHKGDMVMVEGRLSPDVNTGNPRIYTAPDGTQRASYDVAADRVVLLGNRGPLTKDDAARDALYPEANGADDFQF